MGRSVLFVGCGVAITVVLLCVAGVSNGSGDTLSEMQELRNEVAALRDRVEALEKQVEAQDTTVLHRGFWPQGQVPRNWQRFEFNGMPCYVIPLGSGAVPAQKGTESGGSDATEKSSR